MALLEVKNLEVHYGVIKALKDVSFEVNEGEIIALIGANGAGKTTTLHTISGILPVTSGNIILNGQDITKVPAHKIVRLGISQVPEGRRVFSQLSVLDNLKMGAYIRNDKEQIEHYADYRNYMTYEILLTNDILTKAKLSKQSGYNSGAEVQIPYMLILLSALLMIYNDKSSSTRLVFIDEPFAKMDPTNVKIMLGFMKEQNLQMIFCAPDKTELIGNECEVVLPVLRTQPDLMEIGIIEMHKGV